MPKTRLVLAMLLALTATFAFIRPAEASGCKPDGRPFVMIKGQAGLTFRFFANGQLVRANQSQNRAADAARTAGYAKEHAETAIRLAKEKPGNPSIYQYIERAVMRAEIAQGYAVEAVDGGNLQEVILLHQKLTALDQYAVVDHFGAPNPYTDAEYIKAAEEIIQVAARAAEIGQTAADGYRAQRDEAFAKMEAARAAFQKAKQAEDAVKAELAQARAEVQKLRAACNQAVP